MKIQISKETRLALAGALVGGLVGAVGSLLFARMKASKGSETGAKLAAAKEEVLSVQRIGALLWAGITLVREIIEFGAGDE